MKGTLAKEQALHSGDADLRAGGQSDAIAVQQLDYARASVAPLALAALGVVYGDIGTSPLYALRECFAGDRGLVTSVPNVLGVLSLVFWSLTMVVSVKYLMFLMRADNDGEGGILALLALLGPRGSNGASQRSKLLLVGLFGAALLYGDGVITPAISVLSAVEGLRVATDAFEPFILPISVTLLVALFLVQRKEAGSPPGCRPGCLHCVDDVEARSR